MLRLSRAMHQLLEPAAPRRAGAASGPTGPVVIWNLIRRCNLTCMHCYSISADINFPGELDTAEVMRVMDDLKAFGVPALILSGGEPLLRKDIFQIAERAKAMGFYTALSTNGTLIDAPLAARVHQAGFDYVGISLDGLQATHDKFRRKAGAFEKSLAALRLCRDLGVKVGVRFTLTQDNAADLPGMTCRPAARIAAFARVLEPIRAVTCGGGPMKVTPCCAHSCASSGFSERKPQPGWSAEQRVCTAACTTRSTSRYDCAARPGPSTTISRPRV